MQECLIAVGFGLFHTVALLLVFHHVDMSKVAGYDLWWDIASTVFFTVLYSGSYHGTSIGIFAGLFMTAYLRFYRWYYGYKKLERDGFFGWAWFYYHNNPNGDQRLARVKMPKGMC